MRPRFPSILLVILISLTIFTLGAVVDASSSATITITGTVLPHNPPTAKFTASPTCGCKPLTVTVTDQSSGMPFTTWVLNFGDGTVLNIGDRVPSGVYTHKYSTSGSFTVTLTVTNAEGSSSASVKIFTNAVAPCAKISASATSGYIPLTVTFTDKSTGNCFTTWTLDFGDGSPVITTQDPSNMYTHTYTKAGCFTVKLNLKNPKGSSSASVKVTVKAPPIPVANFVGTPTSGKATLTVKFTDKSTNTPTSWAWVFGDGGTSTSQSPSHPYAAGIYSVTLTATNAAGSGSKTMTNYIAVCSVAPTADFLPTITKLAVTFTDKSTGYPTSWKWTFGDGGTSTSQNPSHTYSKAGSYKVVLTSKNFCGSSPSKSITITVSKT